MRVAPLRVAFDCPASRRVAGNGTACPLLNARGGRRGAVSSRLILQTRPSEKWRGGGWGFWPSTVELDCATLGRRYLSSCQPRREALPPTCHRRSSL